MEHYSGEHQKSWRSTKNNFVAWCNDDPPDISKIDNPLLAQFAADLSKKLAIDTVRGYCQYLTSFLRWCYDEQWIDRIPRVRLPRRKKGDKRSKGRPITTEEFERMLQCIKPVFEDRFPDKDSVDEYVESWEFLVKGLWETSLRIGEALKLHWTEGDVRMNLDGRYPMLDFEVMGDKGRITRQLPITPEFTAMVTKLPRRGFVFRPKLSRGPTRSITTWSNTVSDFGRKALILVDENKRTKKKKFASAHDLRRSFLERWRNKVDAEVLQVLARHESLDTTQKYYLGEQAEKVAKAIWGE